MAQLLLKAQKRLAGRHILNSNEWHILQVYIEGMQKLASGLFFLKSKHPKRLRPIFSWLTYLTTKTIFNYKLLLDIAQLLSEAMISLL